MKNTNIGFCEQTKPVILNNDKNVRTIYRDTAVTLNEQGYVTKRTMEIYGKAFYAKSIFPLASTSTATQELISIVDNEKYNGKIYNFIRKI